MRWKPHEVAAIFNIRDFLRLCDLVDEKEGKRMRFDIIGIRNSESGELVVTIVLEDGTRSYVSLPIGHNYGRGFGATTPTSLPTTGR